MNYSYYFCKWFYSVTMIEKDIAQDISLVITTYNRPDSLELVLKSVLLQKVLPCEVIIADDGSGDKTKRIIDKYKTLLPVPLIHSWIEDKGYRLSMSRNVAIAQAHGCYILQLDGDVVILPSFIKDHALLAQRGCFVTGDRAYLTEKATIRHTKKLNTKITPLTWGLIRPLKLFHLPCLNRLFRGHSGLHKVRGCHMAFFKDDFIRVNGYEENFFGWGSEDLELVQRFYHIGLKRKHTKAMACCVHLYHKMESKKYAKRNADLLQDTIVSKRIRAQKGVDQYL